MKRIVVSSLIIAMAYAIQSFICVPPGVLGQSKKATMEKSLILLPAVFLFVISWLAGIFQVILDDVFGLTKPQLAYIQ